MGNSSMPQSFEVLVDVRRLKRNRCQHHVSRPIDLMHNDVILWSRRLKSFENGYS